MMKSNFLNLPSSAAGDARRHVPFRSIIHKPLSVIFVLVFVFSILFSYVHPVAALTDPVFQPVYDTQFYQLPQFVDPLNSTQQDIFYFILGSQVVEYAGLSDYQIENPYSDPDNVGEWFKKIGIDLYNDVLESFAIAGAPVIVSAKWVKDLYANIAGAANFAGKFNNTSFSDWINDVNTNGLNLNLYPSMFYSLNQFFADYNGIYNWQQNEGPFVTELEFKTTYMDNIQTSDYVSRLNIYSPPYVRFNRNGNIYNYRASAIDNLVSYPDFFTRYHNLFINTSNYSIKLCDDNGTLLNVSDVPVHVVYYVDPYVSDDISSIPINISCTYDPNQYNNLVDVARDVFNNNIVLFGNKCFFSDFITNVYFGNDWSNRQELINSDDLNFSVSTNQDYDMPIIETLLDIKGLLQDLLDTNELRQPALDNLTDTQGNPITQSQLQPVSVAVELPDSGISISPGLFTPLTKEGGYINYLWYMTKPLVQYTSDFIQTLVFPDDTGEGFDATGPGVIVFGVICLGLIGGLVVKCLL